MTRDISFVEILLLIQILKNLIRFFTERFSVVRAQEVRSCLQTSFASSPPGKDSLGLLSAKVYIFIGHGPNIFLNDRKKLSHFGQIV